MSTLTVKVSREYIKKIIQEEAAKFAKEKAVKDVKAEETDADELADALENKIDFIKALKIKESKLLESLAIVRKKIKIAQNKK